MTKIAGSGSISQKHGSADPDPDLDPPQNVMDSSAPLLETRDIFDKEFDRMDELVDTLRNRKENVDWVNPWHRDFRDYVNQFKSTNQSFKVLLCFHD
jgi:hypothetical protein